MNIQSIILLILIALCFAAAVIYLLRHKGGCGGCNGNCGSCHKHCGKHT